MSDPTAAPAAAPAAPAPAADMSSAAATFGAVDAPPAGAVDPAAPPAAPDANTPAVDALAMPGKDATPEQWSEFYAKIGRPETAEAYELPVPEGDDGAFANSVKPLLHKAGVTGEQAKALAAGWNEMVATQNAAAAEQAQAAAAAQLAKNQAESAELQNEWGERNTENMHLAKKAVETFFPQGKAGAVISAIEAQVGYKETIKFLHGIGKGLLEGDAAGLGAASNAGGQKSLADRLYPNHK